MKISNIKNKYLRRATYWTVLPLAYAIITAFLIVAMCCAALAGAIANVQWEYKRHWKDTVHGPWEARKHM